MSWLGNISKNLNVQQLGSIQGRLQSVSQSVKSRAESTFNTVKSAIETLADDEEDDDGIQASLLRLQRICL